MNQPIELISILGKNMLPFLIRLKTYSFKAKFCLRFSREWISFFFSQTPEPRRLENLLLLIWVYQHRKRQFVWIQGFFVSSEGFRNHTHHWEWVRLDSEVYGYIFIFVTNNSWWVSFKVSKANMLWATRMCSLVGQKTKNSPNPTLQSLCQSHPIYLSL